MCARFRKPLKKQQMTKTIQLQKFNEKKARKATGVKRILVYADYNCTTGFGVVAKKIVDNLAKNKNYKITVLAINDFAPSQHQDAENVMVFPCLFTSENRKDPFARIEFLKMLYSIDWDLLFCINDPEFFTTLKPHMDIVKTNKKQEKRKMFKSVLYAPIDSQPSQNDLAGFEFFDKIVLYTEYAKSLCQHMVSNQVFKKITVIPHGTDTEIFKPLDIEKRREIQKKMFPNADFVFGTVNRNTARKDLSSLLLGFAQFKHNNQNKAVLYLHTNPLDPMGVNLLNLAGKLNLKVGEDVFFPEKYSENKGVSEEQMNEIYNSFNCFITTTTAEGWGLSVTEAMATKTLVVCPKHTALTEITDDGKNCFSFMFSQPMVFVNDAEKIRFVINPSEVTKLYEVVYGLGQEGEETMKSVEAIIERAYEKIRKTTWDTVNNRFKLVFDSLLK